MAVLEDQSGEDAAYQNVLTVDDVPSSLTTNSEPPQAMPLRLSGIVTWSRLEFRRVVGSSMPLKSALALVVKPVPCTVRTYGSGWPHGDGDAEEMRTGVSSSCDEPRNGDQPTPVICSTLLMS